MEISKELYDYLCGCLYSLSDFYWELEKIDFHMPTKHMLNSDRVFVYNLSSEKNAVEFFEQIRRLYENICKQNNVSLELFPVCPEGVKPLQRKPGLIKKDL